jgi:hypothetical protein
MRGKGNEAELIDMLTSTFVPSVLDHSTDLLIAPPLTNQPALHQSIVKLITIDIRSLNG